MSSTDIDKLLGERVTGEISIQTGFDLDDSSVLFESELHLKSEKKSRQLHDE
jgi:hypothetical protein